MIFSSRLLSALASILALALFAGCETDGLSDADTPETGEFGAVGPDHATPIESEPIRYPISEMRLSFKEIASPDFEAILEDKWTHVRPRHQPPQIVPVNDPRLARNFLEGHQQGFEHEVAFLTVQPIRPPEPQNAHQKAFLDGYREGVLAAAAHKDAFFDEVERQAMQMIAERDMPLDRTKAPTAWGGRREDTTSSHANRESNGIDLSAPRSINLAQ